MQPARLAWLIALLAMPAAAQEVTVGKDVRGNTICIVQEQGDSHRLEVGVTNTGAFVRLADSTLRAETPPLPARVYAGRRMGGRGQERFSQLTSAAVQSVAYQTPRDGGFLLTTTRAPDNLLAVVAEAKDNFLVVEAPDGRVADYVAVYAFDRQAANALMACKRQHVR